MNAEMTSTKQSQKPWLINIRTIHTIRHPLQNGGAGGMNTGELFGALNRKIYNLNLYFGTML